MRRLNTVTFNASDRIARSFFTELLRPAVKTDRAALPAGTTAADDFARMMVAAVTRADEREPRGLKGLMDAYYSAPGAMPGTARGLVEAVTYFVDHKRGTTDEGRMDSAALGQGAVIKQRALDAALAFA
jgi:hypothetical protein